LKARSLFRNSLLSFPEKEGKGVGNASRSLHDGKEGKRERLIPQRKRREGSSGMTTLSSLGRGRGRGHPAPIFSIREEGNPAGGPASYSHTRRGSAMLSLLKKERTRIHLPLTHKKKRGGRPMTFCLTLHQGQENTEVPGGMRWRISFSRRKRRRGGHRPCAYPETMAATGGGREETEGKCHRTVVQKEEMTEENEGLGSTLI